MKKSYLAILLGVSAVTFAATAAVRVQRTVTPAPSAEAGAPGLIGVIRDSDGKPLNGGAVSARGSGQLFTTSVYTDDKGEFVFPRLAAGDYKVWVQAVGYATERADVRLDGSHPVRRDLTLKPLADFEAQLTGAEWFTALPEDTIDHRRMKQVLYVACSGCHGLDVVLNNRFDDTGWTMIVKYMESATYNGYRGSDDIATDQLGWQGQIIRYHRNDLAKYLTEMRGPGTSPMVLKPMSRPTGDAARIVVTQYDLPIAERDNEMSWYHGDDWMKGPSTGMHAIVGVHDVIPDPRGNAWITQSRTTFETNRSLIKLDTASGKMTAYHFVNENGVPIYPEQAGPDSQGNIWMRGQGLLVKCDTSTATFTTYPVPRVFGGVGNSIDPDSKGRVFANGKFGAVELNPSELNNTGVMYPGWHLFQQLTPGNGNTYGISTDADDNPWWSESYSDKVAMRDMKAGKVYEFDMRDPEYEARKALFTSADLAFYDSIGAETWAENSAEPLPYSEMPRRLAADKNGDTVWVPNWAQSNIAEINIHTRKVTYHELPMRMHPYKTTVDKSHNVYADTQVGDGMYKFVPTTKAWTFYQIPTHGCSSRHMSFDDLHGEAWIPCDQADTVDRIQFRSAEQIRALKAAGPTLSDK